MLHKGEIMNALICPISSEKINKSVVRTTGFLVASTVVLYAVTGSVLFMFILLADFTIRGFTTLKISPYAWTAKKISQSLKLKPEFIDKAPKLFASRVGFIFALSAVVIYFANPTVSLVIALTLMSFALLESVFDFCVGCVVYTYIILPINNRKR